MRKVFLSSTGKDLQEYRDAVFASLSRLVGWHCVRMEDFTARSDATTIQHCRQAAADCTVFVGLLGPCYGSIPEGETASYTEQEYDAAKSALRPRLIFLTPGNFRVAADVLDSEPPEHRRKQRAFREKVQRDQHPGNPQAYADPGTLASTVVAALQNWLTAEFPVAPADDQRLHPLARLLNRETQLHLIEDRLAELRRREPNIPPLLVLLRGYAQDSPSAFIQRFVDRRIVSEEAGCAHHRLDWSPEAHLKALQNQVWSALGMPGAFDCGRLADALARSSKVHCFSAAVDLRRWQWRSGAVVREWVEHVCAEWQPSPGPVVVFLACILPEPAAPTCFARLLRLVRQTDRAEKDFVRYIEGLANSREATERLLVSGPFERIDHLEVEAWCHKVEQQLVLPGLAERLRAAPSTLFPNTSHTLPFAEVYEELLDILRDVLPTQPAFKR